MADVQFSEAAMSLTLKYSEVVQTVIRPRRNEEKAQVADKIGYILHFFLIVKHFFLIVKNLKVASV